MNLEISSGPLFVRIGGRYVQTEHTVEEFDQLRADLQRLQSSPAPELSCESCVSRETCPRRGTVCMYHDDGIPESSPAPVVGGVLEESGEEISRMKDVALSCGRHDANGELLCGSCKHSWREANLEDCDEGCSVGRTDLFFHGEPWQDCPDFASRLSSPNAVVGGVPEPTPDDIDAAWNEYAERYPDMLSEDPDADLEVFSAGYRAGASRLSSIKPGEVAIPLSRLSALIDLLVSEGCDCDDTPERGEVHSCFAGRVQAAILGETGDPIHDAADKFWRENDALRSQATSGKEG